VADDLARSYQSADKRAFFLEHDVDNNAHRRKNRFWTAKGGGGSATTPLIVVDSGYKFTEGSHNDFKKKYKEMVDAALARPPQARLDAYYTREGSKAKLWAKITNLSGSTIGYDSHLTLWVLVYEDKNVIHMARFVRGEGQLSIEDDIADGASAEFEVLSNDIRGANWDKVHVLALLDHRPRSSGPYEALQVQEAIFGAPPDPTALVPTEEPTQEPTEVPPTDVPEPTATDVPPTATQPPPTEEPADGHRIYLPLARNE
jgi:hypothetical protein